MDPRSNEEATPATNLTTVQGHSGIHSFHTGGVVVGTGNTRDTTPKRDPQMTSFTVVCSHTTEVSGSDRRKDFVRDREVTTQKRREEEGRTVEPFGESEGPGVEGGRVPPPTSSTESPGKVQFVGPQMGTQ